MWFRGQRLLPRAPGTLARWKPTAHLRAEKAPPPPTLFAEVVDQSGESTDAVPVPLAEQLAEAQARGREEGRREAEAALAAERARLAEAVADIGGLRRLVLAQAEREVLDVASSMARRILHRELQLDPDILLAMAHVALGRLGDRAVATVHLHPADLAACRRASEVTGLTLVADASLPRGGCRISAQEGEIDLGLDAQMAELSRQLIGETTTGVDRAALH